MKKVKKQKLCPKCGLLYSPRAGKSGCPSCAKKKAREKKFFNM